MRPPYLAYDKLIAGHASAQVVPKGEHGAKTEDKGGHGEEKAEEGWGLWHFGMMFTPERGAPELAAVCLGALSLALSSVVWAWFLEKGNRSMAVAIALHAGAHLDNVSRAPDSEVRLKVLRFAVLVVGAALAGRALAKTTRVGHDTAGASSS